MAADDPGKVAQFLAWIVKIRRIQPLDPTPIIDAVRAEGWLDETA